MAQALVWCQGGTGWRPGKVADRMVREVAHNYDEKLGYQFAYFTPVRFHE